MHQLATLKGQKLRYEVARDIYFDTVGFQLNNPAQEFLMAFYNASWKWHRRLFENFITTYCSQNEGAIAHWVHFDLRSKCGGLPPNFRIVELIGEGRPPVENPVLQRAMDYGVGLGEVSQVYHRCGLERRRHVYSLVNRGEEFAEIHCEFATPGLNIFNLLNQVRVRLFKHDEESMALALSATSKIYREQGIEEVVFLADENQAPLVGAEIAKKICELKQIVIVKKRLQDFYNYLCEVLRDPSQLRSKGRSRGSSTGKSRTSFLPLR